MSYHNGPKIVNDGLICYLDAGNSRSYSGSGTTVYDLSGNGNDFTIQGNVSWSSTVGFGNFEGNSTGSGNKIYRSGFPTNLKVAQGGSGLTIMAIARSNVTGGWRKLIGNGDGENYIDLYQGTSTYAWHQDGSGETLYYNAGVNVANDALLINDNVWRVLWATNLNSGTTTNPAAALTLGNEPGSSNSYPWIGNIAVFLLYNRILSTDEMIKNFDALRGRFSL